ncbi:MAG: hypothetical protein WCJ18_08250 [Planctomycetota bacterium]
MKTPQVLEPRPEARVGERLKAWLARGRIAPSSDMLAEVEAMKELLAADSR